MGYQIVDRFPFSGFQGGRCPLSGQYMSAKEIDDDESLEPEAFGGSYDPTDDIIARCDGDDREDTDEDEHWASSDNEPSVDYTGGAYGWNFEAENDAAGRWLREQNAQKMTQPVAADDDLEDDYIVEGEGAIRWLNMLNPEDDSDELAMPSQSDSARDYKLWEQMSGWYTRKYNRLIDSHGKRRRSKKREWWRDLAERRRNSKAQSGVHGEWSYAPNEARVGIYVDSGFYYFMDYKEEPDVVIDYDRERPWPYDYIHLAATQVTRDLLDDWAERGELETEAQRMRREVKEKRAYLRKIGIDPDADRWHALAHGYYEEEFLRTPLYVIGDDYSMFIHQHAGNEYVHGWGNQAPTLPYVDRGWEFLTDSFLRRILLVCPSSLLHNLEELYEAAYWENATPTQEAMEEMEAWQAFELERQDALVESRTFAHAGGPKGIKARLIARATKQDRYAAA